MKKLLLISTILIIVMMTSMSFAKTYSDVKNSKFEQAVDVLSTLEIINGYEDGTYKPGNTVTRAEMAKLIVVSLGKESTANSLKGDTTFSDVKANSWAAGYINCASSIGIIKGYPEGTFQPNKTVSYVEAATMLLRALNYTKKLEGEKYPTGYMKVANDVGLLNTITANSSSEGASRGNVAIMVLNTLKSPVQKIVSTTTKGEVNFGDGSPLLETSFTDMQYVKEGEVIDIDIADSQIYVRDKDNSRRITATVADEDEVKELFKRKVEFIYNKKDDKFISFKIVDKYNLLTVDVDEIDDETIYTKKDSKAEYDLPDDEDVIMLYVSNYDEVETAYLTMDDKKVIGAVLEGTPTVYAGVVTDTDITVSKRAGFEMMTPEGKYKEYPLASTTTKLKNGAVVLFTLNNSEHASLLEKIYPDDGNAIEELTNDSKEKSIKVKKTNKLTIGKDEEYFVYLVDGDTIREGDLGDIEKEFDLACVERVLKTNYIIVFEDCVDDEDIVSSLSVAEAKEKLQKTLKTANTYLKKTTSYSVETFEALSEAVDNANTALKGASSAARLELAERKVSAAIKGLKSSSSSDKQLRIDWENLKDKIEEVEDLNEKDYTAASWAKLAEELKLAKAVNISNTNSSKISERIDALDRAMNLLVTNTANSEIQSALKELNSLISKANTAVKSSSNYTSASISRVETALNNAKKLDQNKASLSEIKTQINNLDAALDGLEAKLLDTYKSNRSTLDATYKDANGRSASNYTEESFNKFKEKFASYSSTYKALKSVSEVEKMSNTDIQNEISKVNTLNTNIKDALKLLVTVSDDNFRSSLKEYIAKGRAYTKETWTSTSVTFEQLQTELTNAEKIAKDSSKTESEIQAAILKLISIGV